MITRKIRHWSLVSQFILTLSKENQESRKYDQTTIILKEVSNSFQLYILCFHFNLSVKITTRNSKNGTFTTLKLFQM